MKGLLLGIAFLCLAFAKAQELTKPRLGWSVQFSTAVTYTSQYTPLFYWQFCEEGCYPTNQQGTFASNLRLMLQRQLNTRLRVGAGVLYSQKRLQEKSMVSNGASTYYPAENTLTLHTIGIPVTLQYDLLQFQKMSFFAESGFVVTFPLESMYIYRDRFQSTAYDWMLGVGGRFTLDKSVSLLVSPSFITALSRYSRPLNATFVPNNDYKPYSVGLEIGLHVRL